MGHQQRRFSLCADDGEDVRGHPQAGLIIQRREGLIQKQDVRLGGQRADEGAALAHPPGELGGPAPGKARQAVALQQPPYGGPVGLIVQPPELQAQDHIFPDAAPLEKAVPLGHEAQAAVGAPEGLAPQLNGAGGELLQPGDGPQKRGFAAAGGPHDADKFPLGHEEGHIRQSSHLPLVGLVAPHGDHWVHA